MTGPAPVIAGLPGSDPVQRQTGRAWLESIGKCAQQEGLETWDGETRLGVQITDGVWMEFADAGDHLGEQLYVDGSPSSEETSPMHGRDALRASKHKADELYGCAIAAGPWIHQTELAKSNETQPNL